MIASTDRTGAIGRPWLASSRQRVTVQDELPREQRPPEPRLDRRHRRAQVKLEHRVLGAVVGEAAAEPQVLGEGAHRHRRRRRRAHFRQDHRETPQCPAVAERDPQDDRPLQHAAPLVRTRLATM